MMTPRSPGFGKMALRKAAPAKRSRIFQKMILGYVFLLLLPCLLFALVYWFLTQSYFAQEKEKLEKEALAQFCESVEHNLDLCESVYDQIYQHQNFLRFLNGMYMAVPKQLDVYAREFESMFLYAENYSPYIADIQVYMLEDGLLKMGNHLNSIDSLRGEFESEAAAQGDWRYDEESGRFVFRKVIRNISIGKTLGVIEISCHVNILTDQINAWSNFSGHTLHIFFKEGHFILSESGMFPTDAPLSDAPTAQQAFSKFPLSVSLVTSTSIKSNLPQYSNVLTLTVWVAISGILLLSVIYFLSVSSLSKRIINFSYFLSKSLTAVPQRYSDAKNDEFSFLVQNFNEMLHSNNQLLHQIEIEQLRQNELAYKVLQAQIDPHFIYNTLESIRMLAELHEEPDISNMIFSLSKLLRYSFSATSDEVTIDAELDLVAQYLKIQKMRFDSRLLYHISCPENLRQYACPQFIIQPLAENAIKYGFCDGTQTLSVSVHVTQEGEALVLRVENNGSRLDAQKLEKINRLLSEGAALNEFSSGTGIGLDSINNRMRYLYPSSFSMEMVQTRQAGGIETRLSWNPQEAKNTRSNRYQEGESAQCVY